MPVQDNEDKRTSEPVVDAEEEFCRKQVQAQEHQQDETNIQRSGKLLPFLNAKAEHHQNRIDNIDGKIATQQDKIAKHTAKIEKLGARADRLEDANRILKATFGDVPIVQSMIKRNEQRIQAIRSEKIPNRTQKLVNCENKIEQFTAKRDRISHKLNRVIALNDTIKSFSIGFNKERREAFVDSMTKLTKASIQCLLDKRDTLLSQKASLTDAYNKPETSMNDKFSIQHKLTVIENRIETIEKKIDYFNCPVDFYEKRTNDELDASIKLTSDKLGEMIQRGTVTMPDLSEETLTSANRIRLLDKAQIAQLAEQLGIQPLNKVEEQLEDDANMIDGIINNGSKSDIDKAKAELSEGIRSMEELVENPFVSEEMREMAAENLAKMKHQLSLLDEADEVFVESWLTDMLDKGQAELTEDGGFRINADYYKELPRNDRHYESMTEIQAVEVMSALMEAGVQFSAASRGEDKVSVTVSKKDVSALNDIMQESIGKTVQRNAQKSQKSHTKSEHYQTINPDYYKSLPKEQRYTRVEPKDTAREIVKGLMTQNIPYSAVVRKNDTVAVTVSKENSQAFKQIEKAVKSKRDVELTDRTNGGKSAVTSTRKDGRRTYFSRSRMQKDVQRISGRVSRNRSRQLKRKIRNYFNENNG